MFRAITIVILGAALWLGIESVCHDTSGIAELGRPLPSLMTLQNLPSWETNAEYEARIRKEILEERARKYWYVGVFYMFVP